MEAFAVSPTPPPAPPSSGAHRNDHSTGDSSFAPTLTKAIDENKTSAQQTTTTSSTKETKRAHQAELDNQDADVAEQDVELAMLPAAEPPAELRPLLPRLGGAAQAMQQQAAVVGGDTAGTPFAPPASRLDVHPVLPNAAPVKAGVDIPSIGTGTVTVDAHLRSDPVVPPIVAASQPANAFPSNGQHHGLILQNILQKNDNVDVTWNTGKPSPHVIMQNGPLPAVDAEKGVFVAPPSLTTESVIAALTEISDSPRATTSLRDGGQTLRQEIGAQLFSARLDPADLANGQSNEQQLFDSDNEQTLAARTAPIARGETEAPATTFSQSLQQIAGEKPSQAQVEMARPAAFMQTIHDGDILQQVMQKFRVSHNLQDSKLVMKLHPAELGELKINVHLKEGAISASIVAQSQQVQEILERNLPRLKTLMEQQGLRVDDISIQLDADVSSDPQLFEDHLARQEDSPSSGRKGNPSRMAFAIEQDGEENAMPGPPQSGVNVKI